MSMAGDGPPRKVTHWFQADVGPVTAIVSASICECHDGLEHTLGVFENREDVVAEMVGKALREMLPPKAHPAIAAVEALVDAQLIVRNVPRSTAP